jgi:hypothetical protein
VTGVGAVVAPARSHNGAGWRRPRASQSRRQGGTVEQHAAQGGIGDPRDKVGAVGRWWHGLEPRARHWGRQWRGGGQGEGTGGAPVREGG